MIITCQNCNFTNTFLDQTIVHTCQNCGHFLQAIKTVTNSPPKSNDPLTVISIFSSLLIEQHSGKKSELDNSYIERIVHSINQFVNVKVYWEHQIGQNMMTNYDRFIKEADIIMLCLSPVFNQSNMAQFLVNRIVENTLQKKIRILPILFQECDWEKEFPALSGRLPLPQDWNGPENQRYKGKPIAKWTHKEDAFLQIERDIRQIIAR